MKALTASRAQKLFEKRLIDLESQAQDVRSQYIAGANPSKPFAMQVLVGIAAEASTLRAAAEAWLPPDLLGAEAALRAVDATYCLVIEQTAHHLIKVARRP